MLQKNEIILFNTDELEVLSVDGEYSKDTLIFYNYLLEGINIENISSLLPGCYDVNYFKFKNDILFLLKNDYKEVIDFVVSANNEDERNEYLKFIKNIEDNYSFLSKYFYNQENGIETEFVESNDNHLWFANLNMQTSYVNSDLDNVADELYGEFEKLLKMMFDLNKDNNYFCTQKRKFTNNVLLKNVSELKTKNLRIIYQHLYDNYFYIIGVFEKKSQKDTGYMNKIKQRVLLCQREYDLYRDLLISGKDKTEVVELQDGHMSEITERVKSLSKGI